MKRISVITLLITLFVSLCTTLNAQSPMRVPAINTPVEIEQPNGEKLTIRLFGDEHKSFRTTIDGYVIVANKKGYYCYGKIKKDAVVVSRHKAHNPENRSKCENKRLQKADKETRLKIDTTKLPN